MPDKTTDTPTRFELTFWDREEHWLCTEIVSATSEREAAAYFHANIQEGERYGLRSVRACSWS